jgi:hypothetical protein
MKILNTTWVLVASGALMLGCLSPDTGTLPQNTQYTESDTVSITPDAGVMIPPPEDTAGTGTSEDTGSSPQDTATPPEDTTSIEPDTTLPDEDTQVVPPEPTCGEMQSNCYQGSECCEGFCTYDGQSYIPGVCQPQQPLGAKCLADSWCESGICADGQCSDGTCQPKQSQCFNGSQCCTGVCSYQFAYIPGSCIDKQPDGAVCLSKEWCQSDQCVEGLCISAACAANTKACTEGDECCSGLCIDGSCSSPLFLGSPCSDNTWCESGVCAEGVCGENNCMAQTEGCWHSEECCTGFCTYDFSGYVAGSCAAKQPNGEICLNDDWCQSNHCVDGVCGAEACLPLDENCFDGTDCCTGMCTYDGKSDIAGQCAKPQPDGSSCVSGDWCLSESCQDGVCIAPDPASLSFEAIYNDIFIPNGCVSCHGSPDGALPMGDMETAYASLVNVKAVNPACGMPTRVVPGSPEQSVLFIRTAPPSDEAPLACGTKMPMGSVGLSPKESNRIRQWILSGAPQ